MQRGLARISPRDLLPQDVYGWQEEIPDAVCEEAMNFDRIMPTRSTTPARVVAIWVGLLVIVLVHGRKDGIAAGYS